MEGAHDVIVAIDVELCVISEDDLAATVLGEEDRVANLHQCRSHTAILEILAWTDGQDSAEVESLLALALEDDATLGLGDRFCLLDDDTV